MVQLRCLAALSQMLKVDPELDEDRVDPKFEVDRNELRWTKAVLDNASLAGATGEALTPGCLLNTRQ